MLSRGFDILLKQGYAETDMKMLSNELNISWERVRAAYSSKEDFYLEALRNILMKSCEEFKYGSNRVSSYRKTYAIYRMSIMELRNRPFISSLYEFYAEADMERIGRFWKIVEDYSKIILVQFNKVLSQQNIKSFIYCIAMMFSKNALVMHDAPSETVCGCGNVESDILSREIKAMRDISKTNEEDMGENSENKINYRICNKNDSAYGITWRSYFV